MAYALRCINLFITQQVVDPDTKPTYATVPLKSRSGTGKGSRTSTDIGSSFEFYSSESPMLTANRGQRGALIPPGDPLPSSLLLPKGSLPR